MDGQQIFRERKTVLAVFTIVGEGASYGDTDRRLALRVARAGARGRQAWPVARSRLADRWTDR